MNKTKELAYLGDMLTATGIEDTARMIAISERLREIADAD